MNLNKHLAEKVMGYKVAFLKESDRDKFSYFDTYGVGWCYRTDRFDHEVPFSAHVTQSWNPSENIEQAMGLLSKRKGWELKDHSEGLIGCYWWIDEIKYFGAGHNVEEAICNAFDLERQGISFTESLANAKKTKIRL